MSEMRRIPRRRDLQVYERGRWGRTLVSLVPAADPPSSPSFCRQSVQQSSVNPKWNRNGSTSPPFPSTGPSPAQPSKKGTSKTGHPSSPFTAQRSLSELRLTPSRWGPFPETEGASPICMPFPLSLASHLSTRFRFQNPETGLPELNRALLAARCSLSAEWQATN
jgi:hypothetical protein